MSFIIYMVEHPTETLIALLGAGIIALAVTVSAILINNKVLK